MPSDHGTNTSSDAKPETGADASANIVQTATWQHQAAVSDVVMTVVGDHFGYYGLSLDTKLRFREDLQADDMDIRELLMTLDEIFGNLKQRDPTNILSISDVIALVEHVRNARTA
jgi:acyl carrier protein